VREWICRAIGMGAGSLLVGALASAQEPGALSGRWEAGPVDTQVAIENWDEACGPSPESGRFPGGGRVELVQRGDTLVITGLGREIRSDGCWGANPKLRPTKSSNAEELWVTRCATDPGEAREEHGTYTLRALGPDRLLYQDVSLFNWKLDRAGCRATVTTQRSFTRHTSNADGENVATEPSVGVADPNPAGRSESPAPARGCSPGQAARISLRPRETELEAGQKVCFQARVEDAAGCALASRGDLAWSIEQRPTSRGVLQGNCFQAGASDADDHVEILAALPGLRGRASVHVRHDPMRELVARRLEGTTSGTSVTPAPSAETDDQPAATRFAARAVGQTEQDQQRLLVGLAALLALAAALLALFRILRGRRKAPKRLQRPTLQCPNCGASYAAGNAFCGNDGTALSPMRRS
jgi:hypothetical protein